MLESLRQPLEERVVRVSRVGGTLTFPADFLLVACANPCPCGRAASLCRCSDPQRARLRGTPWRRNAHIPAGALDCLAALGPAARAEWRGWCETRELTGRGAARLRRVARTNADLADRSDIEAADIDAALYMREDLW